MVCPTEILIHIRISVVRITQVNEINISVIIGRRRIGPDRKEPTLAAETSESLLLMLRVADKIRSLARRMDLAATTETLAIQLGHDHILGRLGRGVIVQ